MSHPTERDIISARQNVMIEGIKPLIQDRVERLTRSKLARAFEDIRQRRMTPDLAYTVLMELYALQKVLGDLPRSLETDKAAAKYVGANNNRGE